MTTAAPGNDLQRIGDSIRDRRERLGLLQKQVAEAANISAYHYRDIENGRVKASRIAYLRIAAALNLTVDEMDQLIGAGAA